MEKPLLKELKFFPLPVIYYTPETRFVFGLGAGFTTNLRNDSMNTKRSQFTVGLSFSQNKQILFYIPVQMYLRNAKYFLFGELGYYRYSYFYFGESLNEIPEEEYKVNFPRIILNFTKKVNKNIYAGFRFHYEDYNIKEFKIGGGIDRATVYGTKGNYFTGLGAVLIYDTRDSLFFPGKGMYLELKSLHCNHNVFSSSTFNKFEFNFSIYKTLNKQIITAFNLFGNVNTGEIPFQQLSLIGGNKKLRGYYEGRYRDKNSLGAQADFRINIVGRLGINIFGGIAALGNNATLIRTNKLYTAGGIGLRFNVIRKDHFNIRLDYAIGEKSNGTYFTIGEAF